MEFEMKKRILFVDDEPMVLDGLRRMLRGMRNEWDMEFAPGGTEALKILEQSSFNVVVSDMRMPGIDGCELFNRVKDLQPQVVRIILSGHSDKEMILRSVRQAHQYIAKPCDAETLKATIARACTLSGLLQNRMLVDLISGMDSLPSMPTLYAEVIREIDSPYGSINRVGEIIAKDVGMSAKILQLVNSAFFGLPKQISNPVRAVTLIGLETVKSLVLSVKVFSEFEKKDFPGFSVEALWKHSMRTGLYAKKIASEQKLGPNAVDEAFMAGLLHDAGKLILLDRLPLKYRQILKMVDSTGCFSWEAEQQVLGTTHAPLAAYLIGIWGLPEHLVHAIAFHHCPSEAHDTAFNILTAVHAANYIEHEQNDESGTRLDGLDLGYLEKLGCADRVDLWQSICGEKDGLE